MPAVQHRHYRSHVAFKFVVDGERESVSKCTMQATRGLGMNARMQDQRVDVRVKAVEEIVANAGLLPLLESIGFEQVRFRRTCDPDMRHFNPL